MVLILMFAIFFSAMTVNFVAKLFVHFKKKETLYIFINLLDSMGPLRRLVLLFLFRGYVWKNYWGNFVASTWYNFCRLYWSLLQEPWLLLKIVWTPLSLGTSGFLSCRWKTADTVVDGWNNGASAPLRLCSRFLFQKSHQLSSRIFAIFIKNKSEKKQIRIV